MSKLTNLSEEWCANCGNVTVLKDSVEKCKKCGAIIVACNTCKHIFEAPFDGNCRNCENGSKFIEQPRKP
jgi:hypothetical protein